MIITDYIHRNLFQNGKASNLDHRLPDHVEHQKSELNACCLVWDKAF
jgi:hypothetical protein